MSLITGVITFKAYSDTWDTLDILKDLPNPIDCMSDTVDSTNSHSLGPHHFARGPQHTIRRVWCLYRPHLHIKEQHALPTSFEHQADITKGSSAEFASFLNAT
jgi:hypothetical protein